MKRIPLSLRLALAVLLGVGAGVIVGRPLVAVGEAGLWVVRVLKMLAAPLLFFAIVDAFVRAEIPARLGGRLVAIAAVNAAIAAGIGLGVARVLGFGERWQGHLSELTGVVSGTAPRVADPTHAPSSIVDIFASPNLIPLVIFACAVGIALRSIAEEPDATLLGRAAHGGYLVAAKLLAWLVELVPLAVALILASVVAKNGLSVFRLLGGFVVTIVVGMAIYVIGWYSLLLLAARRSPRRFFAEGADAIATALSAGSSLATLPVTLAALARMRVSESAARLSACVGTNLNHAGIILYEAAAALFVAQALGWPTTIADGARIALASVLAGIGISGVPEAGLITLPVVLSAAGVDEATVTAIVPLLFSVDWLIGRLRAAVNVTSDMVVANLLERQL